MIMKVTHLKCRIDTPAALDNKRALYAEEFHYPYRKHNLALGHNLHKNESDRPYRLLFFSTYAAKKQFSRMAFYS